MFNERSRAAVDASTFGPRFRRPLYDSYNFANIPRSLPWLFSGAGGPALPADVFGPFAGPFDHVVFCFVDAFGWQHVERALGVSRFLRETAERGVLSKLTAMFPSTTAAHVTAVHTAQTPAQAGVYAWQYHEPALGAIIEPLPFAFLGQPRESLRLTAADPSAVFPGPSIYPGLAELGVRSFVLQPVEIAHSTCNKVYTAGAEARPYKGLGEALVALRDIVLNERGPTYTILYWDRIDSVSHVHGPGSEEVAAEVDLFWLAFDRAVHDRLGKARRALVMVSSDHGHALTGKPVYLNRDLPDVIPMLQRDRLGRPLGPAGSRRDYFLHVREEHLGEVRDRLRGALAGKAEVYPTAELIAQGFFGAEPATERLLSRVGNLVVLPYPGESVWWQEAGLTSEKASSHGGLTPQEVDVPLAVMAYG